MSGPSPYLIELIHTFANSIGVEAIASVDGSFSFQFSQSGLLTFAAASQPGRVFISLERAVDRRSPQNLETFLIGAGYDQSVDCCLHACMDDQENLIYVYDVDEEKLDSSYLHTVVRRLIEKMDGSFGIL